MKTRTFARRACVVGVVACLVVACGGELRGVGGTTGAALGNIACPELQGGTANASFDADARANATIRAFVTATADLAAVAVKVEADVAAACEQMGRDLGVSAEKMTPKRDESRAAVVCAAVADRMGSILGSGGSARLKVQGTAPQCSVDANLATACRGQCAGSAEGAAAAAGGSGTAAATANASANAQCEASCKAHAELTAQCTPAQVTVESSVNTGELPQLVRTLSANLPPLIAAQTAYGTRIADDVQVLVVTGSELPRAFAHLSTRAGACVGAAANACLNAQASLRVSVKASASVTAKVGAGGGV